MSVSLGSGASACCECALCNDSVTLVGQTEGCAHDTCIRLGKPAFRHLQISIKDWEVKIKLN